MYNYVTGFMLGAVLVLFLVRLDANKAAEPPPPAAMAPAGSGYVDIRLLGCVPNDESAGTKNSRLINESLVKRIGGSYFIPGGRWHFAKPIQVPAGYPARFWSQGLGMWKYHSNDKVEFVPTKTFPKHRSLIEFGGPDAPNGEFKYQARGCEVIRIGFDCGKRGDVGAIAFYQNEASRVVSCQFYGCWRGVMIHSRDLRMLMNTLVESCQFAACDIGVSVVGEGSGQTFGGNTISNCVFKRCGDGIYLKHRGLMLLRSLTVENSRRHGLLMDFAKATSISCYYENRLSDITLKNQSMLYFVGWNTNYTKLKSDYGSVFVGEHPDAAAR